MKRRQLLASTFVCLGLLLSGVAKNIEKTLAMETNQETIELPSPRKDSDFSVERALQERRTVRQLREDPITLSQLSQLLWAVQGITDHRGFRTAPSAGALYPLEIYVMVGHVDGLSAGLYRYRPKGHTLLAIADDDRRNQIADAAWDQDWMARSSVLIAFCSVDSRTTGKYGRRGVRYIHIEVGHAAQNVLLQAQALGLSAGVVGAFDDDAVRVILDLSEGERALYFIPIGKTQ